MSIFQEYASIFPECNNKLAIQMDIDIAKINTQYILENSLEDSVMIEADNTSSESKNDSPKSGGFSKWIKKIISRIGKFFQDIGTMIKDMFSGGEHLTLDNYMDTEEGALKVDVDLTVVQHAVDDEIRKGRKLIQAISNGTGIDDRTVEKFVDGGADLVIKRGKPVLVTAAGYAILKHSDAQSKKTFAQIEGAGNDAMKVTDPKKQAQCRGIMNKISHLGNELGKARIEYARVLSRQRSNK